MLASKLSEAPDIRVLKLTLKICNYLGILSWNTSVRIKIWISLIFLCQMCFFILYFMYMDSQKNNINTIFSNFVGTFYFFYTLTTFYNVFNTKKHLKRLMKNLGNVDKLMEINKIIELKQSQLRREWIPFIFFHIIAGGTACFRLYQNFTIITKLDKLFLHKAILVYQMMMSMFIMKCLLSVLKKKYEKVENKLKSIYSIENNSNTNFVNIRALYYLLHDCVSIMNDLFGIRIMIVLMMAFLDTLNLFIMFYAGYIEWDSLTPCINYAFKVVSKLYIIKKYYISI